MYRSDAITKAQLRSLITKVSVSVWSKKKPSAVTGTPRDYRIGVDEKTIRALESAGYRLELTIEQ